MQISKGQIIELDIETLAFGGRGLSHYAGMVTFTDGVVPGDCVEVRVTKIRKRHLETQLLRVVKPSNLRIEPRCLHFGKCGGCIWQYLSYDQQLSFKEKHAFETIEHIGGIRGYERKPIIGCENPWFYRNKIELSFGYDSDGKPALGFHLPKRRYDIFDLQECFLANEWCPRIADAVRKFFFDHQLNDPKPFHCGSNTGLLHSLYIREGKRTGDIMLNLVISEESFPDVQAFRDFIIQECEKIFDSSDHKLASLYITRKIVQKGRKTEIQETLLYGTPVIRECLGVDGQIFQFHIYPQSFFQPNTFQAEILYETALKMADLHGEEIIFDLFCGTGTIGLIFARRAKQVYGVEINESAVNNAQESAKLNEINNIEFFCEDVEKWLKDGVSRLKPDLVVVDPPRSGLSAHAIEYICMAAPQKILYVSCNPATFARDAKLFTDHAYELQIVQPIDMFPHTHHIEVVSMFR